VRILWINFGLLPEACKLMGYAPDAGCGWVPSLLEALLSIEQNNEYCVLSLDYRPCDVQIGRVRNVSMAIDKIRFTYRRIPDVIQSKIAEIIRGFQPDVIHIHGTEYFFGCMDESVYGGVPVVVSLQGILSGCARQMNGALHPDEVRWTNFCLRGILKGQTILGEQHKWLKDRTEQESRVIKQQRNFIGRTEWDESWVRYYNPSARYYHVDEALRSVFYSESHKYQKRLHSIFCAGAASCPLKGAHWLIRAVFALKNEFPDIQLRIAAADYLRSDRPLFARLKDPPYWAYLRKLIRDLRLQDNIAILPSLSATEMRDELERAELFVLPSMCENSPNSLGEAMLVGTPSIATFVGGVPSILKDGVEGKLVLPGDPAALAGAIRHWFLHPEEAESCVQKARQTALKRHDAKANAEATLAVYKELSGK
jgi:glycosyltransferase involved in cell wall biosynthesis